jgi:Flp pilus assembly pilin Flp
MIRLPALRRDERGTALIEFGFLAPFLAMLAMGVIDLSRGLAERFALQQAVNRSLELVQARPPSPPPPRPTSTTASSGPRPRPPRAFRKAR